ncbi:hypothetical protein AGMMS50230_12760 [Spirochaetia bacterium]|nr:hypothetical protein AGMMS50230_12760 [Spirochaetia bacterium]
MITIEQTVELPASHRLTLEVPPVIPTGRVRVTFTPEPEHRLSPQEAIEKCWGIAEGSSWTSDRLLEERRKDKDREEAKYHRMFRKNENVS